MKDRVQAAAAVDAPKLLAARRLAVTTCPYLAVALHAIAIVPTYAVPTMGVDRHWRCYVNPAFVSAHAVRDLAGVWLHEVSHLVRDHHTRARRLTGASVRHEAVGRPGSAPLDPGNPRREQVRLNIAMDLEINDDLLESLRDPDNANTPDDTGPRLPKDALTPASLRVPERDLFEEYVHDVTLSMVAAHWTDCGSGAHDGPTPWEDDAAGAHPLGDYEAAAIRISVRDASPPAAAPPRRAGSAGPSATARRRRTGARSSAPPSAPRSVRRRVPATTPTAAPAAAARAWAADWCCRACAGRCRRWPWSSTPPARSPTRTSAVP